MRSSARVLLDAELAALVSLTFEAGIPIVVAGEPGTGRTALRDALLDLLPAGARTVTLAGEAETFAWMAEAVELGWRHEGPWVPEAGADRIRARDGDAPTVLVADLEDGSGAATWGERARLVVRSLAVGYGLAATAAGTRLEDVLGRLAAAPVGAIDDELTRLGVVLILGRDDAGAQTRARGALPAPGGARRPRSHPAPAARGAGDVEPVRGPLRPLRVGRRGGAGRKDGPPARGVRARAGRPGPAPRAAAAPARAPDSIPPAPSTG